MLSSGVINMDWAFLIWDLRVAHFWTFAEIAERTALEQVFASCSHLMVAIVDCCRQDNSSMRIEDTEAGGFGGGGFFTGGVVRLRAASLEIQRSRATGRDGGHFVGGGFLAAALDLMRSSLSIRDASAQSGGAFTLISSLVTSHARITESTVVIERCAATRSGGAFTTMPPPTSDVGHGEVLISDSNMRISHVTAKVSGGGFEVGSLSLRRSEVRLEHASARDAGGIFSWKSMLISNQSRVALFNTTATGDWGGIKAQETLELTGGSKVLIEQSEAAGNGGGASVQLRTRIAEGSAMVS